MLKAAQKSITRKWGQTVAPTKDQWRATIEDIYIMDWDYKNKKWTKSGKNGQYINEKVVRAPCILFLYVSAILKLNKMQMSKEKKLWGQSQSGWIPVYPDVMVI